MSERVHRDATEELEFLPIFPLPSITFFPGTLLPLHIFEPRYRAMTSYCIERDWPIAVVSIRAGHESEHLGAPPVADVAGVGSIVHHEVLADGRFHMLLRGVRRVRIAEELNTDRPYRVVRAEPLDDEVGDSDLAASRVRTLEQCVLALGQHAPGALEAFQSTLHGVSDPAELTYALASMIVVEPRVRQRILELTRVEARAQALIDVVGELLVEMAANTRH